MALVVSGVSSSSIISMAMESNCWVLSMRLRWDNIGDMAGDVVGGVNGDNRMSGESEGFTENSDGGIAAKCAGCRAVPALSSTESLFLLELSKGCMIN